MSDKEIVDKYLDQKELESAWHGIYSLPTALRQEFITGANLVVPGDKPKEIYKQISKLHADGNSNDDIDDGRLSHEAPKFVVDSLATYPLATAVATGVNLMNLADPRAESFYKFGGNVLSNVALSAAKAKVAGKDYTWGDLGKDIVSNIGTGVLGGLRTMPHLGEYMGTNIGNKTLVHGAKVAKAAAKELLEDEYLNDESSLDNFDNLYAYRDVRK